MATNQNQTNTFQGTITATENSTSNTLVNRSFAPQLNANNGVFGTYYLNPAAPYTLQFPSALAVAYNVYLRNLAASGGGNVAFQVTWQGIANPNTFILHQGTCLLTGRILILLATAGIGISAIIAENVGSSSASLSSLSVAKESYV